MNLAQWLTVILLIELSIMVVADCWEAVVGMNILIGIGVGIGMWAPFVWTWLGTL